MFEMLETLEARQLMSGTPIPLASTSGGVMTIAGTTGNDKFGVDFLHVNGQQVRVSGSSAVPLLPGVTLTSSYDYTLSLQGVSKVVVDAGDGNDSVKLVGGFGLPSGDLVNLPLQIGGGKGNDQLDGRLGGYALFDGGAGADKIVGNADNTIVDYHKRKRDLLIDRNTPGGDGEAGENDSIANNLTYVLLGSGNDTYFGATDPAKACINRVFGNRGIDKIIGGPFADELHGGDQDDVLTGGTGGGYFYGDAGNDTIDVRASQSFVNVFGGDDNDRLRLRSNQEFSMDGVENPVIG